MQNNIFVEMLPLIAFFAVYYFTKNIFIATGVCIVASWLQVGFLYLKYKKVSKNTLLSCVLITVFGGLTVALHNKTFIMLKPSLLYWIMGVSMLVGQVMGKNGVKILLKEQIQLRDKDWAFLNLAWVSFFIIMGFLNLYIALTFSEYLWVKFKVFGGLLLMLLFMLACGIYVYRKQVKS